MSQLSFQNKTDIPLSVWQYVFDQDEVKYLPECMKLPWKHSISRWWYITAMWKINSRNKIITFVIFLIRAPVSPFNGWFMLFLFDLPILRMSGQAFYWSTILALFALVWTDFNVDECMLGWSSNVVVFGLKWHAQKCTFCIFIISGCSLLFVSSVS